MGRKGEDGRGGDGGVYVGLYVGGRGFEVRWLLRIDLLQTIDHARLGPGLILFLRGFVSGRCYTFFFFVELLDIVLFFG